MTDSPSPTAIRSRLHSEGFAIDSVDRISASVYRAEDADESVRYVKIVPEDNLNAVRTLVDACAQVGAPRSRLVDGTPPLQIMEPVKGRPLSHVIPMLLIPGVWSLSRNDLHSAFRTLGTLVGQIHDRTSDGTDQFRVVELYLDKYGAITENGLHDRLRNELDPATVRRIESRLERNSIVEANRSVIHGDLILSHVFYSDGEIRLIDFDRAQTSASVFDLVSFECAFDLMIHRLPWATRAQFRSLRDEFRAGYGDARSDSIADESVRTLALVKFCSLLLYYYVSAEPLTYSFPPPAAALTKPVDVRILKGRIRSLV